MKKNFINQTADAIYLATDPTKKTSFGFNMTPYVCRSGDYEDKTGHGCTTVGCIAGWMAHLTGYRGRDEAEVKRRARIAAGLTLQQADELFAPSNVGLGAAEPIQAVRVLRHLANTGEVDWSHRVRDNDY